MITFLNDVDELASNLQFWKKLLPKHRSSSVSLTAEWHLNSRTALIHRTVFSKQQTSVISSCKNCGNLTLFYFLVVYLQIPYHFGIFLLRLWITLIKLSIFACILQFCSQNRSVGNSFWIVAESHTQYAP